MIVASSTVADGNMSVTWGSEAAVEQNRTAFLARLGLKREDAVIMDLMHDDRIEVVGTESRGRYVRAEALLTNEPGLVLAVLTADCCPISFYDPVHKAVALGHMSWQTTTLELSKKVARRMIAEFGTDPKDLVITIGPSARKESYIQQEVLQKTIPNWAPFLSDVQGGTAIDVAGYNVAQLAEVGVSGAQVTIDPSDTIPSVAYYSHYRSVRTGELEGRFATIVAV